jgi:hypothetical protein
MISAVTLFFLFMSIVKIIGTIYYLTYSFLKSEPIYFGEEERILNWIAFAYILTYIFI